MKKTLRMLIGTLFAVIVAGCGKKCPPPEPSPEPIPAGGGGFPFLKCLANAQCTMAAFTAAGFDTNAVHNYGICESTYCRAYLNNPPPTGQPMRQCSSGDTYTCPNGLGTATCSGGIWGNCS